MTRNSGIIGPKTLPSAAAAPGVFDTFDNYNARRNSIWPSPPTITGVTLSGTGVALTTVYENSAVTATVSALGITPTTTYYWTISHNTTTNSDFVSSVVSGSFNITNNSGTFTFNTAFIGNTGKTSRTFYIQIRSGSTSGTVLFTSSLYTIPAIAAGTSLSTSSVQEGSGGAYFYLSLSSIGNYSTYTATLTNSGTATSADFSGGWPTTITVGYSQGSALYTPLSDGSTEGTESVTVQASYGGVNLGPSQTINITDPPSLPSYVTSGNKTPVLGNGGAATYPPTGWTGLQNSSSDDAAVAVPIPFTFTFMGTGYTTAYMGSNTYVTFGGSSTNYSGLSASNPALNKFHLGSSDNSYQRVSYVQNGTSYVRIRYEGNGSTSGTVGSPGITLEITLFNSANYGGAQVCEVLVGNHNRTGGVFGAYSTSASIMSSTQTLNSYWSYTFVGNAGGTSWAVYNGYVNNSGY